MYADAPAPGEMYVEGIDVVNCTGIGIAFYSGGGTGWTQILGHNWQVLKGSPKYGIYIQGVNKIQVTNLQLDSVYTQGGIYMTDVAYSDGTAMPCANNSFANVLFGGSSPPSGGQTLTAPISSGSTTSIPISTPGQIQNGDYIAMPNLTSHPTAGEIMWVAGGGGSTTLTVVRGCMGTSPLASIASGVTISIQAAPDVIAAFTYIESTPRQDQLNGSIGNVIGVGSGQGSTPIIYGTQTPLPNQFVLPGLLPQTGPVASGTNAGVVFRPGYRIIGVDWLSNFGTLGGTNNAPAPGVPGVPAAGAKVYNPFPFRVAIYLAYGTNPPSAIQIVNANGVVGGQGDNTLPSTTTPMVELDPGEGIYFVSYGPLAWTWRAAG